MAGPNAQSPDLRARELATLFHLVICGPARLVCGDRRQCYRSEQDLVRSVTSRPHRRSRRNIRPHRPKTMTGNEQFQFLVRAPANGAPVARCGSRPTGGRASRSGSTPIGDRAQSQFGRDFLEGRSMTATGKSVTHVLNQKCYLCFDRTASEK